MLDLLLDLGWKSVLVSGLALLVGHGVPRLAASERVMVLRAGVAALLMLPFFALAMPVLKLAVLPVQQATFPIVPAAPLDPSMSEPMGASIGVMPWLYGAGVALVLVHLIAGVLTLRRWTRAAVPPLEARWIDALTGATARLRRPVRLLVSSHVPGPLSWGIAPAWLLIGPAAEKCPEQAEAVIAHEMAHVRRFDWPVLMASRVAIALYWFNPLVWLLARTLAHQTELAADDDAVQYMTQVDYAQTLLTVASPAVPAVACGMTVSRAMLVGRIRRVLEAGPRRPANRLLGPALLVCVPGVAVPLAATQLVPVAGISVVDAGRVALPRNDLPAPPVQVAPAPQSDTMPAVARVVETPPPLVAIASRSTPPSRDWGAEGRQAAADARRNAAEIRATAAVRRGFGADGARVEAEVREARANEARSGRTRRGPEMDERRAIALGLSNSAIEIRAEAERVEADINKRDVSQEERSGTLAGARAMRNEADRLDREARRLVFGR